MDNLFQIFSISHQVSDYFTITSLEEIKDNPGVVEHLVPSWYQQKKWLDVFEFMLKNIWDSSSVPV